MTLILLPVILYNLLVGLSIAGMVSLGNSSSILEGLSLVVILLWLISVLTPFILPLYLRKKLAGRRLPVFVLVEITVYAVWLAFLHLGLNSTPPLFYYTYWFPPTFMTIVGYVFQRGIHERSP